MAEWIFKEKVSSLGYKYIDAVDRQELVRCKDCKYCVIAGGNNNINLCKRDINIAMPDDWFCADGERRG